MSAEHFKEIASRQIRAYEGLVANLAGAGGIEESDAKSVADFYISHKLVKLDMWNGRYTVKHGGLLDKMTISNAVDAIKSGALKIKKARNKG
jgi:hypothetical protein